MTESPICITIAGSDSCGGAGIQADLKTFHAHHCYGMSVITATTAQTHTHVSDVHAIPSTHLVQQLSALLDEYQIAAVKTGMFANADQVKNVAKILSKYPHIPIVVDPVLGSSTGSNWATNDLIDTYKTHLLPISTIVTPNTIEAKALYGAGSNSEINTLINETHCALLLKGGHASQADHSTITDELFHLRQQGEIHAHRFTHPRVHTTNTHGTGCTLASSIAANLAHGLDLTDACAKSITFLQRCLRASNGFLTKQIRSPADNLPMNHNFE